MLRSPNELQQTQTFSINYENVLPEHYRLIELIGRGGMAEVFLAEDRRLGRKVAIKFLNNEFRRDPDRVRRFRQEARSASALNHPNILTIHDIGEKDGIQFIVSEFVEGETLGTRIAQGRLPISEAVDIAIQIASALSASHAAGIVHRDIKPDNIMIRRDGAVKVLDFGLAKARGFTTANGADFDAMTLDSGSTSPGLIVGTPQYMSPEQARGKELDGRTDIFSLGIIIFEMVTRHSPFAAGSFADTMAAILTKEPRQMNEFVDDAPDRLVDLVGKCLKKQLDERFPSMTDLEAELKLLKSELTEHPRTTTEIDPARSDRTQIRPTHQHSIRKYISNTFHKPSPLAAVIILVAAGLLVGGWWAWDRVSVRVTAPSLMRTVPITSWSSSASELVTSASFSPDGKMVAFSARKGDSTEIWVKPVVGGDAVQVTKNGGQNQYPIWSPDGQEIAFFSDRGNRFGIWKIPFTGGNLTKIIDGLDPSARPTRWGKTGSIFYQSSREVIRLVDDRKPETVADLSSLGPHVRSFEISPDETKLAFSIKEDTGWKVRVKELSGETSREVASTKDQIDHIAWHPNGKSVFCSFSIEGILQVFEVSPDGGEQIQRTNGDLNFVVHDVSENGSVLYGTVTETSDLWKVDTSQNTESIVANEVASELWPDVAADGSVVYQSSPRVERLGLSSIRATNGRESGVSSDVAQSGFAPTWSNNGVWIAFLRRTGTRNELWKSRRGGLDLMRVSDADVMMPQYYVAPYNRTSVSDISWSPDDSKIAITSRVDGGVGLSVVSANEPHDLATIVQDEGVERSPIWTPDGRSIVYLSIAGKSPTSPDRTYRIFSIAVDSLQKSLLFESKFPLRLLGFANDGRSLITALNPDREESKTVAEFVDIYSISPTSGAAVKIKSLKDAYHYNTHLSKNGETLSFVRRVGDMTEILTLPLSGGNTSSHLQVNDPKILISNMGLSRDGGLIVFGKQTRTNLLSMLTR